MSDDRLPWIMLPIFFIAVAALMIWHFRKASSMLARWASENGYRILKKRYRWIFRGPFWWRLSDKMLVYRVTVKDAEGTVRRGWVRCGGGFMGLSNDQVAVVWD